MSYVYIKPRESFVAPVEVPISLGMLAEIASDDSELERQLRGRPLLRPLTEGQGAVIVSALDLVRSVQASRRGLDIRLFGPQSTVVRPRIRQSPFWARFWLVGVSLLLFFGAMLAIMFFHADVEMQEVHQAIYELVTGDEVDRPWLLQIPYAFGVGLGVLLFFNSLSRRKPSSDPSPLDIQMYLYDQSTDGYMRNEDTPRPGPKKEVP